jgi:hypothetical protein
MADIESNLETENIVSIRNVNSEQEAVELEAQISRLPFNFEKRHSLIISKENYK